VAKVANTKPSMNILTPVAAVIRRRKARAPPIDGASQEAYMSTVGPVVLGPNQPPRFYRGGAKIAAFRDLAHPAAGADHLPEDWVGSATQLFGAVTDGLTSLPDGRLLRDAIIADPAGYLGPGHVERHGTSTGLLVKLLDAGQRLPVHCHPDDAFATRHLASAWGKTEAWIVLDAAPGSEVRIGFTEEIPAGTLAGWVDRQDPAMLGALNRIGVQPGDAILVPAGLPHTIGEGVFIVELQEPTDFSVLLEWEPFPVDGPAEGHLGLGYDLALNCVDRSAWDTSQLAALHGRAGADTGCVVSRVFPAAADPFFVAERIRPGAAAAVADPGFAVLVVLAGPGVLRSEAGCDVPLSRGMTVLVPYGAGRTEIAGGCEVIRCLPPDGSFARPGR
jgi:mannose-6-phosphate isomerase